MKQVVMAEFSDVRHDARVLKEAATLAGGGYKVLLIMYNASLDRKRQSEGNNVFFVEIPFEKRYDTANWYHRIGRLFAFLRVLASYTFEVLRAKGEYYHAHNFYIGWLVYISSVIHKGKFVYDCHEIIWENDGSFVYRVGILIEKYMTAHALVAIAPSSDRSRLLAEHYKLDRSPIVLSNYPNLTAPHPSPGNRLKKQLGIAFDAKILFFSGMLSVKTRLQDNILRALPSLPENVYFVAVGFGHPGEVRYLAQIARELRVRHRFIILPPVGHRELHEYAACADIGMCLLADLGLAMRFHALNKFYEYASAGLAVLASDFPTFRKEILENPVGPMGAVCDPHDAASVAESLKDLLADPTRLTTYRRNALRLHERIWNWEAQQKTLIQAYAQI